MPSFRTTGDRIGIMDRWERQLTRAGGATIGRPLALATASAPPLPDRFQVELGELSVAAPASARGTRALLLLGLLGRGASIGPHHTSHSDLSVRQELVVIGPDTFWEHGGSNPLGLTAAGIRLGDPGAPVSHVSVLVLCVDTATRASDVVTSIMALARTLDYLADPAGSDAVATEILDRTGALLDAPRTRVAVAGRYTALIDEPEQNVLFGRDLSAVAGGEVKGGRVIVRDRHGQALDLRGADYLYLRIGAPKPHQAAVRTLDELIREQELLDHREAVEAAGSPATYEEPFGHKLARTRFAMRGQDLVHAVGDGDQSSAHQLYIAGLSQEYAGELMADGILAPVESIGAYLRLSRLVAAADVPGSLGEVDRTVRARLAEGLDRLLGFTAPTEQRSLPMMTPLVMEVHDSLRHLVDPQLDGGEFLHRLVPEMRERVQRSMAVPEPPSLRARTSTDLAPGSFTVQVNEIPVLHGGADHPAYAVKAGGRWPAGDTIAYPAAYHPLTGERGRWWLVPRNEPDPDDTVLTAAQFLCCQLEHTVRGHLHRLIGLDLLEHFLTEWPQDGAGLLDRVRADSKLQLRLLWLVQELLREGVPLLEQDVILEELVRRDDPRELHRAVRDRMRDHLPGTREEALMLPEDLQSDLWEASPSGLPERGEPRLRLLSWLRETVTEHSPFLSLAVADDQVRELLVPLVRAHSPLITTFTYRELRSR
ncbi:FHIPEP family type III secretion protein [Streptomyces torulosus]|uniref:FHIPEP family type III secretion protein n=1 Tax=Streptomyces torulosus TaxID=68276 RepID=UPI0006EBC1D6|nr:FHIPEP family type III secretion protein [Streptomyces torulosus]